MLTTNQYIRYFPVVTPPKISLSSFCLIKQQLQPLKTSQQKFEFKNFCLRVFKQTYDQLKISCDFTVIAQ